MAAVVGPAARRMGFRALRAYLAHEAALTPDEHRARDDAGRFSLPRAACDALIRSVGELTEDGLMEKLHDPAGKACAVCSREPRSCPSSTTARFLKTNKKSLNSLFSEGAATRYTNTEHGVVWDCRPPTRALHRG